jgi:hypothetical protein
MGKINKRHVVPTKPAKKFFIKLSAKISPMGTQFFETVPLHLGLGIRKETTIGPRKCRKQNDSTNTALSISIKHLHVSAMHNHHQAVYRSRKNYTDMRRLTSGIRFEKCVVRRFRRCANVIDCTCTNLDSIAYYRYASLNVGDTS